MALVGAGEGGGQAIEHPLPHAHQCFQTRLLQERRQSFPVWFELTEGKLPGNAIHPPGRRHAFEQQE